MTCGRPAEGTRCPEHTRARNAQKAAHYTRDGWREYAAAIIAAEPWCHECGARGVKLVGGHIVPARLGGRMARPICVSCNRKEA